MKEFLAAIGSVVVAAVSVIVRGWVICVMWGWFISPALGIPKLYLALGVGVSLFIQVATIDLSVTRKKMDEIEDTLKIIGKGFLAYGYALALGWIFHFFI